MTETIIRRDSKKTAERILQAATDEFTEKGFGGARVDAVALRANSNKRMIYHYFGNKDQLFLAVLEQAYAKIRTQEHELHLEDIEPEQAVRTLVRFTFNYFVENPEFIHLLNSENLHKAAHIKESKKILAMRSPLIEKITDVLNRGGTSGLFRTGVDPTQFYITVASLGYFYLSNSYTLETVFGRSLMEEKALNERLSHCEEVVLGYLRP
ncbi:TetR/AcrR family transcriptional regulator [Thalassotalea psychrophila]|uniref:TetR/AcrR family transcriptional regulator n=1 Tax=Thalassotalea psychrophila TaxID=3065647 RepID=A0ABY9TWB8_9GAMM|nr:TetR/AcrR family transcriptional regulator [Colwelliaceae bacterium SQ149]